MEKTTQELNESLAKMKSLMQYDLKTTLLENEESVEEQSQRKLDRQARRADFKTNRDLGMKRGEAKDVRSATKDAQRGARKGEVDAEAEPDDNFEQDFVGKELKHINRLVRRLHRWNSKIGEAMATIEASTYNGGSGLDAVKTAYQEKYGEPLPMAGATAVAPSPAPASTWKPSYPKCQGGVNKVGCRSNAVGKVQAWLDNIGVDGKFGPETQKRLASVAPEFSKEFTDTDLPAIRAKIDASNAPRELPPQKINLKQNPNIITPKLPPSETLGDVLKQRQSNEQGATNMAMGFVNESISQKERKRINKEDRKNKKIGLS